jgi:signal transduction histidine kinase
VRVLTDFTLLPQSRRALRFALAVGSAIVAVLLRWVLDPALGHVAFYVTVYIAVAFCALVCGFVPAIVSGLLGFAGIFYWFVDPRNSLTPHSSEVHGFVGFFFVSAVLTALGQATRTKQLRLNSVVADLTLEAEQRQRVQSELRAAHDLLEDRVRERTHELSETLARLESEIQVREQAEERLRHLSLRLMTLQDDERRRIARELHDTAGQTLAAMKMSIALIRQSRGITPDLLLLVDDLNALTDEALQEVRTASYLLHPPLLDEAGIASATRWFVQGFSDRSGIKVICDIPENLDRPSRHCELVLFRVLQESLTNVHRHSEASEAVIRLQQDDDNLALEIADNGKGIPEDRLSRLNDAAAVAGVGLSGMRERVHELGGHFEIHSNSSGTTIRVALPVLHKEPVPATLTL